MQAGVWNGRHAEAGTVPVTFREEAVSMGRRGHCGGAGGTGEGSMNRASTELQSKVRYGLCLHFWRLAAMSNAGLRVYVSLSLLGLCTPTLAVCV